MDVFFNLRETKLDESVKNSYVHTPGFKIVRCDGNWIVRGVCLYIKTSINYLVRTDLNINNLEHLSATAKRFQFSANTSEQSCSFALKYFLEEKNENKKKRGKVSSEVARRQRRSEYECTAVIHIKIQNGGRENENRGNICNQKASFTLTLIINTNILVAV